MNVVYTILIVILSSILFFLALYIFLGEYLCNYAFSRNGKYKKNIEKNHKKKFVNEDDKYWSNAKKIEIKSQDELKLCGYYKDNGNARIVLIIHGFGANHTEMTMHAKLFEKMGFDILAIDTRAHGESDGKYLSFGQNESDDVAKWIEKILALKENYNIVLFGISMGATTALLSTKILPFQVKAVISDCAFNNADEQLQYFYSFRKRKPKFLYKLFIGYARRTKKIDMKKIDVSSVLKSANIPILVFHGQDDNYVPVKNAYEIFESIPAGKGELHLLKNAKHCECLEMNRGEYRKIIINFLEKNNI